MKRSFPFCAALLLSLALDPLDTGHTYQIVGFLLLAALATIELGVAAFAAAMRMAKRWSEPSEPYPVHRNMRLS